MHITITITIFTAQVNVVFKVKLKLMVFDVYYKAYSKMEQ